MRGLSRAMHRRNEHINLVYGCEIDPNCYVYRMINGVKTLVRVMPGMPEELTGKMASRAWNLDDMDRGKGCAV